MRPSELLGMRWDDFDPDARTVLLRYTKNGLPRTVPLSTRALNVIKETPRCGALSLSFQPMHSGLHGSD